MPPKHAFLEVAIGRDPDVHRIEVELFHDVVPKTVTNFLEFCRGTKMDGKLYTYKKTPFHRVIKDFMVQGGDIVNGDGSGRVSIFGKCFDDENFKLKHDQKYLLSMANSGKNSNGCQFFITCVPTPHLDGKHVVFGKVTKGTEVVDRIEGVPVDNKSRPLADVLISNCGEIKELKKKKSEKAKEEAQKAKKKKKEESSSESDSSGSSSSSSSSDSDSSESESSEDEKKKKKKKQKKTRGRKRKASTSSSSSSSSDSGEGEEGENQENETEGVSTIKLSDIADLPPDRHSFLYRHSKTPEREGEDGDKDKKKKKEKTEKETKSKDKRRSGRERSRSPDRRGDRRRERSRSTDRRLSGRLSGRVDFSKRNRSRSRSPPRNDRRRSEGAGAGGVKVKGRGANMYGLSVLRGEEPQRWKQATQRVQKFSDYMKKKEEEAAKEE